MKNHLKVSFVLLYLALLALPSQAQIIDNFNSTTESDIGNYTTVQTYDAGGTQAFSISGGELVPTGTGASTYAFLRNTGQSLSDTTFGESISIDAVSLNNYSLVGFRLSTSDTGVDNGPLGADNSYEFGILGNLNAPTSSVATSGNVYTSGLGAALTLNFSLGSITETVTRESDTVFDYKLAGPGLTSGPGYSALTPYVTGSFTYAAAAGNNVYFGPDFFANGNAGSQKADNLAFYDVPEPSTYAMMIGGVAFLGFLIRRKGVCSQV